MNNLYINLTFLVYCTYISPRYVAIYVIENITLGKINLQSDKFDMTYILICLMGVVLNKVTLI